MAESDQRRDAPRDDRRWPALAMLAVAVAHAPGLAGGLLDADRLLLVRNPDIRSFAGLGVMLADGQPLAIGAGLVVRDHTPLRVLSTWLGWQWLQASAVLQHAAQLGLALAIGAALLALLRPRGAPAAAAAAALMLHPCAADLTAPLLGRGALLATLVVLLAARRARDESAARAVAWSAAAAFVAGACAPGWGLLGLVAALMIDAPRVRRAAVLASIAGAIAAVAIHRADLAGVALPGALSAGAGAAWAAWIPSVWPFVIATADGAAILGLVLIVCLAALALLGAQRAPDAGGAALMRAGGGALLAVLPASALACREGTVTGAAAFALQLGLVLALAGLWDVIAARGRPWMAALLLIPAALTMLRARAWANEDRVLSAVMVRDAEDPEAILAAARAGLRRGKLEEAAPLCLRYASLAPETRRADGCIAAAAVRDGQDDAAVVLLRRWAARYDDKRALRAAVLEIAGAQPDARFGDAFRRATGYNMPARRSGEP